MSVLQRIAFVSSTRNYRNRPKNESEQVKGHDGFYRTSVLTSYRSLNQVIKVIGQKR